MESTKMYDIKLVIDLLEIEGGNKTSSVKVTCIECYGNDVYVGTQEGFLIQYCIPGAKTNMFYSKIREVNLHKGEPVYYLRCASAFGSFITLLGSTITMYRMDTLEPKGSSNLSGVSFLSVDNNPIDSDPFAVMLCYVKKKSLLLATAHEKGFTHLKEISVESPPVSLAIDSGLVCAALSSGKYIMVNMNQQKKSLVEVLSLDKKEMSLSVINVAKNEFLLLGPGGLGVFATNHGTSERPPIVWAGKVSQLVLDGIHIVAMSNDRIFVNSLPNPETGSSISFPGVKCISHSAGILYVATARSLYKFVPISIDNQIQGLLEAEKIEQAFSLLQMSSMSQEKRLILLKLIHERAVFVRLASLDIDACKESLQESCLDLREIISLFPNILPSSSVFTRHLPPFHNYANVDQITQSNPEKIRILGNFALDLLMKDHMFTHSKDLATSAIKMSVTFNKEVYRLLLNHIHDMIFDLEDCIEWMQEEKRYISLAMLFMYSNRFERGVTLWLSVLKEELPLEGETKDDLFDNLIAMLVMCKEPSLVWPAFEKLYELDSLKAIEIFTKREPSPTFQPINVAEKLHNKRKVCILYLKHCIQQRNMIEEDLHTFLATSYIEELEGNMQRDELFENLRAEFREFIVESNHLKVQYLIGKLSGTSLRLELALMHGKAGDHFPALQLIVNELKDHEFARNYCRNIANTKQKEESFLSLVKIYLEKDSTENNSHCLELISDFIREFDLSKVLPLLPDDWSISFLSSLLRSALRVKLHKERLLKLKMGLSRSVQKRLYLEMDSCNQGFQINEESICHICMKKLSISEPILHDRGLVIHSKCA